MTEFVGYGDSLTWGSGLSDQPTQCYPSQLLALNFARRVENLGFPGCVIGQLIQQGADNVDSKWLSQYSAHVVATWAGSNNLAAGQDGNSIAGLQLICSQDRRDAGAYSIILSPLPRSSEGQDPGFEAQRQVMRTNLAANWQASADYYLDIGGNATIGIQGSQDNPVYYLPDKTHLTQAGYTIVVSAILTALNSLS